MRDRSIDEFESIFEQASIPVLDIREITLDRVSVVIVGSPLDETVIDLAAHLHARFKAQVHVHWPGRTEAQSARDSARAKGLVPASDPFHSTAELVGQVGMVRSKLVLLPEPDDEEARGVETDALVRATAPPILLVRTPLPAPAATFGKVLHSLTGNFQQTRNFEYSFTLVEDSGAVMLLHSIRAEDIQSVRDTLQVSPDIAEKTGDELLQSLTHHGERYLKAVAAAGRDLPYDVSYRLAVGDVVETVRRELNDKDYGLLVVGCHHEGQSHLDADDYQLMHWVRDIPVLAL